MKDDSRECVDLNDQKGVLALTIRSFEDATQSAAAENDCLGIPSPVGVEGQVIWVPPTSHSEKTFDPVLDEVPPSRGPPVTPWMWIVGGPNGAGKTTFTREFLRCLGHPDLLSLNADDRTQQLLRHSPGIPLDEVNLQAAREIDAEVLAAIRSGRSFLVETVLSSDKYRDDLLEAKTRGFRIGLFYVSVNPAALSPARVSVRVRKGGHDVDVKKALARHARSHLQAAWFAQYADTFIAYDNSSRERTPVLVAARLMGEPLVHRNPGVNPALDAVIHTIMGAPAPDGADDRVG